jgi:hypothetical protein
MVPVSHVDVNTQLRMEMTELTWAHSIVHEPHPYMRDLQSREDLSVS